MSVCAHACGEREKDRQTNREREREMCVGVCVCEGPIFQLLQYFLGYTPSLLFCYNCSFVL